MSKTLHFLFIPLILIFFLSLLMIQNSVNLNIYALDVIKGKIKSSDNNYEFLNYKDLNIHHEWLEMMVLMQRSDNQSYKNDFLNAIKYSNLHASMTRAFYPKDLELATEAYQIYPNNKSYLYWLLDSSESDIELSKIILHEILAISPNDVVAWRRLGKILWNNGELEDGLNAYLNACEINDIDSNGCFYVAISYHSLGDLEKALFYFRKSFFPPSWVLADKIEAELSSQNP